MRRILALVAMVSPMLVVVTPAHGHPAAIGAEPVVTGLAYPAGFTFAPDGRIFYGARYTGEIRIYDPATGSDTLFFTITNLETTKEQGLLGIALDPRYPIRPLVYAYATRTVSGEPHNQILRVRDVGGVGMRPRVIWTEDIVAAPAHNGGRIRFGPDRMLYAVVGEAGNSGNAQDLTVDGGKILRMTSSGQVPPDNPFPDSLVWTYGHRNSFGFTFDPLTDILWETENGPECNDEVNTIPVGGANYGWGPISSCAEPPPPPDNTNQDGPDPVLPLLWFTPTNAIVGDAFCVGCGIPDSEGDLFFGGWKDYTVHRAILTPDRTGIESEAIVYTHANRPISFEVGPDGSVYFSDSEGIWKLVAA